MSNVLRHKKYLTLGEAATLLHYTWGEAVEAVDVIDLSEAGHFKLSVRLQCSVGTANFKIDNNPSDYPADIWPGVYDIDNQERPFWEDGSLVFDVEFLRVLNHDGMEVCLHSDKRILGEAVVKTSALLSFIDSVTDKPTEKTGPTSDNPKATESMLKMVMAMAVDCYGYSPSDKKSTVTADIVRAVESIGHKIDADTVRKWLKEGGRYLAETDDWQTTKPKSV